MGIDFIADNSKLLVRYIPDDVNISAWYEAKQQKGKDFIVKKTFYVTQDNFVEINEEENSITFVCGYYKDDYIYFPAYILSTRRDYYINSSFRKLF